MVRTKSGETLRVNERSAQLLNVSLDRLQGKYLGDFDAPEALLREDREVIESGKPLLNVVHELKSSDGRFSWIRLDRVPFQNPSTGDTCVYSLAQDVSDIHVAEQALRASEERFNLAVRGAGVGLWDWDIANDTLFWSERFKQMMGVDDEGFGGKIEDFSDRLHPADKEAAMAAIDHHLERRLPFDVQYRLCRDDGDYHWIEARGQAVWDENGKPRHFLGSVDDITDRREDEIQLRTKSEQMLMVERMAGIGYWLVDPVEKTVIWSDQVYAIHGETPESLTPDVDTGIAFYHPDDQEMVRRHVEDGMASGEPFEFEARLVRRSGEERIVYSVCRTEKDAAGKVVALFGVFSDITERRQQEQERQAALDELFRSNAELSRFSYVCSHDLKEPVGTLGSMAEILLDDEKPVNEDERRELLSRIHLNSQRLSGIIENLSAFSRIDGKLTIENVDLNETVEEVQESLGISIDEAEASFDIDALPTIQGAKVHFRQLFQNLIGNALKYRTSDTCKIAITCKDE